MSIDLKRLREMCNAAIPVLRKQTVHIYVEDASIPTTKTACDYYKEAGKVLPALLDEIERLERELKEARRGHHA